MCLLCVGGLMCVLFVCLGNICWLFIVEGVFWCKVEEVGLVFCIYVDFVGIVGWYVGKVFD